MGDLSKLREAIEDDGTLRESAARALEEYPDVGVGDDDLEQVLRAFQSLMLEELDGGGETRALFMETAIPAFLADGIPAASLIGAATHVAVDVTPRLMAAVPPEDADRAREWLACFWSAYLKDVAAAAIGGAQ